MFPFSIRSTRDIKNAAQTNWPVCKTDKNKNLKRHLR